MMSRPLFGSELMTEPQSLKGAELAFLALLLRRAEATVHLDSNVTEEDRGRFFHALGKYYRAPRKEIEAVADLGLLLDEIPVVLHLARHSGLPSAEVAQLRVEERDFQARHLQRGGGLLVSSRCACW